MSMVSQWTRGHSHTCKGEHADTHPTFWTLTGHWTLLDTTHSGPAQLPRRVALAATGLSPRAAAPRYREPWSSVRGERLSARIIHCHGKIIRSVRSTESRPRVFRYARTYRLAHRTKDRRARRSPRGFTSGLAWQDPDTHDSTITRVDMSMCMSRKCSFVLLVVPFGPAP